MPPKPGDGYKNKQYTLSPGFSVTEEGLKLTLIEAQRIEADLIYGRFSWEVKQDQLTVEKAILANYEITVSIQNYDDVYGLKINYSCKINSEYSIYSTV